MLNNYIKKRFIETKLFKFKPNLDLLVAIITLLLTWVSYYGVEHWYRSNSTFDLLAGIVLFIIVTNIFINVVFPIWWVVYYRKLSLSDLGITSKLLIPSLILGCILALWKGISLPELVVGINWVPHLIVSALIFWEPFFVFGWLQSRYEKSFGIIPAILFAAASFILYQIGTADISSLLYLFGTYIILATVMASTKNIFSLWPIYWCIGSSVNSLSSGMKPYNWDIVAIYAIVLIIHIWYIRKAYKKQNKTNKK